MESLVIAFFVIASIIFVLFAMAASSPQAQPYENPDLQLICPHCQVKGKVRTTRVELKKGISGGKAMGGILTGGVSLLATGLSRKEPATQAHCSNCNSTWHF